MKYILTTLALLFTLSLSAQTPVFTFECFSNANMTGDSCDICTGTSFQSRSFNGLMVYRLGVFNKWIDEPYLIRLRPGNSVEFIDQSGSTPDKITIPLSQTQFTTVAGFIDSTFCAGANIDFSFFASDSLRTTEINYLDTLSIVGRGGTTVFFDTLTQKYIITSGSGGAGTDLSFSGTSSPVTLNSSTGADVTITAGAGNSLSATGTNITITATDQSATNEAQSLTSGTNTVTLSAVSGVGGGTVTVDTNPSDDVTGSGTTNYVSKFTSAKIIGNSQVFDNGTNVGINTDTPSQRLDVNGGLMLRYATVNPDTVNGWLTLGGINTLAGSSGGSVIGPLSSFNANINRPIRTLILQGASDGNGEGISFVTGSAKSERLNIGRNGTYLFNALSGTGNRFPVLDASGFLTRGTVDPASLVLGNGSANQVTYYTAPQSITSSANFTFNGTNIGMGGIATPSHRLDVNGGNINIRYNNAAAPNTGSEWLTLGSYNSLPTGQAANHIYSGSGSGTILGTPIGGLFLQGRSDNNTFSNIYFVTGATPVMKQTITSDGVYFNDSFRGGTASFIAGWNINGKSTDIGIGSGLSFSSGSLSVSSAGLSKWSLSGSDIYNTALGNVAVGTTGTTVSKFRVSGNSASTCARLDAGILDAFGSNLLLSGSSTSSIFAINSRHSANGNVLHEFTNQYNTSTSAHSIVQVNSGGSGGGDPLLQLKVQGESDNVVIGVDNDELNKFRISRSDALSTGNESGLTVLTDSKTGVNEIDPPYMLAVNGTDGIGFPSGTTLERPAISMPVIRFNNNIGGFEAGATNNAWYRISSTQTPTVTWNSGIIGTGGSVTFTSGSNDVCGTLVITTGATPTGTNVSAFTIVFTTPYNTVTPFGMIAARNAITATEWNKFHIGTTNTLQMAIGVAAALAPSTEYRINYRIQQ